MNRRHSTYAPSGAVAIEGEGQVLGGPVREREMKRDNVSTVHNWAILVVFESGLVESDIVEGEVCSRPEFTNREGPGGVRGESRQDHRNDPGHSDDRQGGNQNHDLRFGPHQSRMTF